MDLDEVGLNHLTGVEDLVHLKHLYLDGNQISDISPLENLRNLQTLYLKSNKVEKVEVLNNLRELRRIDVSENQIRKIKSVSHLSRLIELNISHNPIEDFHETNFYYHFYLLILKAESCGITALTNGMPGNIFSLYLGNNSISDISYISSTTLRKLDLTNNKITDLSTLKYASSLYDLNMNGNPLGYHELEINGVKSVPATSENCPVNPETSSEIRNWCRDKIEFSQSFGSTFTTSGE